MGAAAFRTPRAQRRNGRRDLASNVLELHRFDRPADPRPLIEQVTIRERGGILPAALCLARASRAEGLRLMVWHDLASLAPLLDAQGQDVNTVAFGWDAQALGLWGSRENALHNPALRACRMESEPFLIGSDGIAARWATPALREVPLDEFTLRTGLRAAILVPVHLPFGQIGAGVLTGIDPLDDLAEAFARLSDGLTAAIRRFVRGYVTVTRDARYLPQQCLLSPREIECLSWVAQGKTDYEISIILGCSHAGVRYHLTRACERLGAVNRAQSVFRASQLGFIGPGAP
jgi:DNA-binding CsgD family transcriptional regulator